MPAAASDMPDRDRGVPPLREARIDLHCHSRYSSSANMWLATELGFKESHSEPAAVYGLAKMRGMTHVTLTDHDTIEGALRLAHHEDFIIGEEVTAFFPSEALNVHVLVWGIDEQEHTEIGELRFNVFELAEYLRKHGIAHALAHPFSLVAGGLRGEQLEALLVLFDVWEVRNGLSCRAEDELAEDVVARSASLRARIAGATKVSAATPIGACAGSDDHTGLDVGATYTVISLEADDATPLTALMSGVGRPCGSHGSTAKLAHNGVALFLGESANRSGPIQHALARATRIPLTWQILVRPGGRRLAARALSAVSASKRLWHGDRQTPLDAAIGDISQEILRDDGLSRGVDHEQLQARVEAAWRSAMREQLGDTEHLDIGALLGDKKRLAAITDAQSLLAPYVFAAGFHARQRRHTVAVAARLAERGLALGPGVKTMPRVAMLTDTYEEINGVGTVLRELVRHVNAREWPFTLVSAGAERRSEPGREVFPAVESHSLDVYPGFPMALLPILETLRWCEESDIDVIHAATPGPVGLVALLLASSLDLPLVGTFHTDLPNLGFSLTGDHLLKESLWAYVRLFYDQCDIVFCPSEATRLELVEHRVKSRLEPFPQGIDCGLFDPARRDENRRRELGDGKRVLLWVGRMSPEKGLDALAASYAALRARRDDVQLVIVGEGPYEARLREVAPEASFLGVKTGAELATIYASADVFLFPGHAETFGQTVLEAAASGLPAVVSAGSGTEDAMIRDVTALSVAPGDSRGFVAATERLLDDGELHARMRTAARRYALSRTWPATFERLADAYRTLAL
jgi:glycosyltransferase involved in cell wall biosynthesis/predicted metal-dependent phosphoesterase TrpH